MSVNRTANMTLPIVDPQPVSEVTVKAVSSDTATVSISLFE